MTKTPATTRHDKTASSEVVADQKSIGMKPRVIIVGAGFGGLTAAQHLTDAGVDITLIDKRNHHLFQPLLYQVATADLSPAQIAFPIRAIFRNQSNVSVVLGEVAGVDLASSEVELDDHRIGFDYLVLAT